jgi:putative salt-induced outer membrane protein YdiY
MSKMKRITSGLAAWLLVITAAHFALNVDWSVLMNDRMPEGKRKLNLAYIPVT